MGSANLPSEPPDRQAPRDDLWSQRLEEHSQRGFKRFLVRQVAFQQTQRKRAEMNPEIEDINDEDDDVLIQMQNDDGVVVTFLTAPPSVFEVTDRIDPLTFWMSPNDVYVAINEDILNEMIEESIEKNNGVYDNEEAAFLPIVHVLAIGLKEVNQQITQRGEKIGE